MHAPEQDRQGVSSQAGASMVWVFATTLLQFYTDDEFRGRVFSFDFAFLAGAMALATYGIGLLVDAGVPVRALAVVAGIVAGVPAVGWVFVLRRWPGERAAAGKGDGRI